MLKATNCPSCGASTGPFDERCGNCHKLVLPRQGGTKRMLLGLAMTAFGAYLLIQLGLDGKFDPAMAGFWTGLGVLLVLWGVRRRRQGGPMWRRLTIRARQGFRRDPEAALADFIRAAQFAPGCESASLGNREEIGTRRGVGLPKALMQMALARYGPGSGEPVAPDGREAGDTDAVAHRLHQTYVAEVCTMAFASSRLGASDELAANVVGWLGGPSSGDIKEQMIANKLGSFRQRMGLIRAALLDRGLVEAVGYCAKCKDAVDLTSSAPQTQATAAAWEAAGVFVPRSMICANDPAHTVNRHVVYEVPDAIEAYRSAIRWIERVKTRAAGTTSAGRMAARLGV